jgi:hypothetical protein
MQINREQNWRIEKLCYERELSLNELLDEMERLRYQISKHNKIEKKKGCEDV